MISAKSNDSQAGESFNVLKTVSFVHPISDGLGPCHELLFGEGRGGRLPRNDDFAVLDADNLLPPTDNSTSFRVIGRVKLGSVSTTDSLGLTL